MTEYPDLFTEYIQYMSSIGLKTTEIYELEAKENLTNLGAIEFEQKDGYQYADLSNQEYTMYATVTSIKNKEELDNFFKDTLVGRTTMCVSVETNLHTDYYSKGLTFGYTQIPEGAYIMSSPTNVGSNSVISTNQSEVDDIWGKMNNTPIRESKGAGHSETLLYREGLKPSCIICRDDNPSDLEIMAAKELGIPIVKLQRPGLVAVNDTSLEIIETSFEYENKISEFIKRLDYGKIKEAYLLQEVHIGNSHTMYEGVLKGDDARYYLKPAMTKDGEEDLYRAYAMESASVIQKLVYEGSEIDSSVSVKLVTSEVDGEETLFSAIEVIPESVDLSISNVENYTKQQVETFLREMIVDHLVFNYDAKRPNFLISSSGQIFGIDKEQALKHVLDKNFIDDKTGEFKTGIDLEYSPNGNELFYLTLIQNNTVTRSSLESIRKTCLMIQSIEDSQYLSIFKGYIDEFIKANPSTSREQLEKSILARKNNLVEDFEKLESQFIIDESTVLESEIETKVEVQDTIIVKSKEIGLVEGANIIGINNNLLALSQLLEKKDINDTNIKSNVVSNITGNFVSDFSSNNDELQGPLWVLQDGETKEVSSLVISLKEDNTDPTKRPMLIQRLRNDIVRTGKYIPIVEKTTGELLLTEEEYNDIRKKMNGLSSYGFTEFSISDLLHKSNPDIEKYIDKISLNEVETKKKESAILDTLRNAVKGLGLDISTSLSLSDSNVLQVISTGSTGRNTNLPGDGDFDFIVRVDSSILHDYTSFAKLKTKLLQILGKMDSNGNSLLVGKDVVSGNGFRLHGITIDGIEQKLDIDITFTEKTDEIIYTTEKAVEERLQTIRRQSEEDYQRVVANILYAKEFLKQNKAYKRKKSDKTQGGLGGVGVENWILQNGGSFEQAMRSFLGVANKSKNMIEFESQYEIWDYGQNHISLEKNRYPYDNYIYNMNPTGYEKMKYAINKYIEQLDQIKEVESVETIVDAEVIELNEDKNLNLQAANPNKGAGAQNVKVSKIDYEKIYKLKQKDIVLDQIEQRITKKAQQLFDKMKPALSHILSLNPELKNISNELFDIDKFTCFLPRALFIKLYEPANGATFDNSGVRKKILISLNTYRTEKQIFRTLIHEWFHYVTCNKFKKITGIKYSERYRGFNESLNELLTKVVFDKMYQILLRSNNIDKQDYLYEYDPTSGYTDMVKIVFPLLEIIDPNYAKISKAYMNNDINAIKQVFIDFFQDSDQGSKIFNQLIDSCEKYYESEKDMQKRSQALKELSDLHKTIQIEASRKANAYKQIVRKEKVITNKVAINNNSVITDLMNALNTTSAKYNINIKDLLNVYLKTGNINYFSQSVRNLVGQYNVEQIKNAFNSVINDIIKASDEHSKKYPGDGDNAILRLCNNGSYNFITSSGGARGLLQKYPIDIIRFIVNNNFVKLN